MQTSGDEQFSAARLLTQWLSDAVQQLSGQEQKLNRLNVFPIPDADTGTNMLRTLRCAQRADSGHSEGISSASSDPDDLGTFFHPVAEAALTQATGNSGTLLATLLGSFATGLRGIASRDECAFRIQGQSWDQNVLHQCLKRAFEDCRSALSAPRNGTFLSVLNAAAHTSSWRMLLEDAFQALQRTTEELPVLRRYDVVDAGGLGLFVILRALVEAFDSQQRQHFSYDELLGYLTGPTVENTAGPTTGLDSHAEFPDAHSVGADVELMATLQASAVVASRLRTACSGMAESVVLTRIPTAAEYDVDTADPTEISLRWRLHAHCHDPQQLLDLISAEGGMLLEQHQYLVHGQNDEKQPPHSSPEAGS